MNRQTLNTSLKEYSCISSVHRRILCEKLDDPVTTPQELEMFQSLYDGPGSKDAVVDTCNRIVCLRSLEELLTENTYIPEDAKKELLSLPSSSTEQIYYELATGGRNRTIYTLARQLCACMRPTMTNIDAYQYLRRSIHHLSEEMQKCVMVIDGILSGDIQAVQEQLDTHCCYLFALPEDNLQIIKCHLLSDREKMVLTTALLVTKSRPKLLGPLIFAINCISIPEGKCLYPGPCLDKMDEYLVEEKLLEPYSYYRPAANIAIGITLIAVTLWFMNTLLKGGLSPFPTATMSIIVPLPITIWMCAYCTDVLESDAGRHAKITTVFTSLFTIILALVCRVEFLQISQIEYIQYLSLILTTLMCTIAIALTN